MTSTLDGTVLVVGDAIVDIVRADSDQELTYPGGAALNVAVGMARLGCRVHHMHPVADDSHGRMVRMYLRREQVEVIALPGGRDTGVARSLTLDGEPTYEFSAAVVNRMYEFPGEALAKVAGARAVVVSSYPMDDPAQVDRLLEMIGQLDAPLAVDANARPALLPDPTAYRDGFLRLAGVATLVKASREDLGLLFDDVDQAIILLQALCVTLVVSDGARGATIFWQGDVCAAAPPKGPVVSTIGAGDALFARLARDIGTSSWPDNIQAWQSLLREALAVAAETCTVHSPVIPRQTNVIS